MYICSKNSFMWVKHMTTELNINGLYICAIANQPRDHLLHTCNVQRKKHFHHKKGLPKTTPNECLETLRVICLSWRQHASGHLAGDGGNESCTPTAPFF